MKSNNGKSPVSGPRDSLIDADRLYQVIYCPICSEEAQKPTRTQHIFCELRTSGLGYACLECMSERTETRVIKRDRRVKSERPQAKLVS